MQEFWHVCRVPACILVHTCVYQPVCQSLSKTCSGPLSLYSFTKRTQPVCCMLIPHGFWNVTSPIASGCSCNLLRLTWAMLDLEGGCHYPCRWRTWERKIRFALVWTAFIFMTLFFMVPVGAVQSLLEVNRLEKIPFFSTLVSYPFLRSIITAILPGAGFESNDEFCA